MVAGEHEAGVVVLWEVLGLLLGPSRLLHRLRQGGPGETHPRPWGVQSCASAA